MVRSIARRILAVPLVAKLVGANVIIVASAVLLQSFAFSGRTAELVTVVIGLSAALLVNLVLVRVALKPIDELENLAERVSGGDFEARGEPSVFADKELARLGQTVNQLLDALAAERRRIQELGAQVMRAQDVERASISRELHDSIAQTLAAVRFQVAAASREADQSEARNRLAAVNAMISSAMEEIMNVSYTLHSRVAEDLGIEAALRALARQVRERSGVEVTLQVNHSTIAPAAIPPATSATLFKVAEEVLRSIETRSDAGTAVINLVLAEGSVSIEITDDGDVAEIPLMPGLNQVKDRVLLAGGKMTIGTTESGGMRVRAEMKTMRAAS